MLGSLNPVYCVLCSLALWLEMNLKLNPTAMNSPYVFCISNNVRVPDGGLKTKAMIQSAFTLLFSDMRNLRARTMAMALVLNYLCWEVTAYESMLHHLHEDAA